MSMKIDENAGVMQSAPEWLQNMKVANLNQKVDRNLSHEASKAVSVTLSKEGKDFYRKKLQESETQGVTYEEVLKSRETAAKASNALTTNYNVLLSDEANRLKEKFEGDTYTISNRAKDYVKAYANLHDEIVHGYENGTRERYVADDEAEDGYRKMTMEEELKALDEAYQKATAWGDRLKKADKILKENAEKIQRIKVRATSTVSNSDKKQEQTENVQDKLK